jgi:HlyD family secretion protein
MTKKQTYWFIAGTIALVAILIVLSKTGILGKDDSIKVAVEEVTQHDIIESVSASGKYIQWLKSK